MRNFRILASLSVLSLLLFGLAAAPAPAQQAKAYQLVFLQTGPKDGQLTEAENKSVFTGHFSNINRLADERKLLVAGPFGAVRHQPDLRGLFILDTAKREEAQAWAGTDPSVIAGLFKLEYHDLSTGAALAAALERHFAEEKKAKQEGRELKMEESMRGYVWLIADRAKARPLVQPLAAEKKVFLVGDLDASQLLVLLDAKDVAAAREKYSDLLAKLGDYQLSEWHGSVQLAN
jgi:uncharacterized protein YciI